MLGGIELLKKIRRKSAQIDSHVAIRDQERELIRIPVFFFITRNTGLVFLSTYHYVRVKWYNSVSYYKKNTGVPITPQEEKRKKSRCSNNRELKSK